jgi:copper chaperone
MRKVTITINNMTCNHCKNAVERGLKDLDGVKEVEVKLDEKLANVTFDEAKISLDVIYKEIEEMGYEPVKK